MGIFSVDCLFSYIFPSVPLGSLPQHNLEDHQQGKNFQSFLYFKHIFYFYIFIFPAVVYSFYLLLFSCLIVSYSLQPHGPQHTAFLSFTISWRLLRFMSMESVMPSNCLILCRPFSSCPQSFPASRCFPMSLLSSSGDQRIGISASVLSIINNSVIVSSITRVNFL